MLCPEWPHGGSRCQLIWPLLLKHTAAVLCSALCAWLCQGLVYSSRWASAACSGQLGPARALQPLSWTTRCSLRIDAMPHASWKPLLNGLCCLLVAVYCIGVCVCQLFGRLQADRTASHRPIQPPENL